MKESIQVNGEKRKQDVVGDAIGTGLIMFWEENVGVLKDGVGYHLGFMVHEYGSKKYLLMARDGSLATVIGDIGDIMPIDV